MELDPEVIGYYGRADERGRLTNGLSLELVRTQALLERFLPQAPAKVLDVGGGAGVYASWLAARGYQVHLIDPVARHVEQARSDGAGFTAAVGDARDLVEADDSCDAVLLLGPLYHLVDQTDRIRALQEARRVCRSGGVVLAAGISRYASTFDGFFRGLVDSPGFVPMMMVDRRSGLHRNPGRVPQRFTTAYFHDPDDLGNELVEAGLGDVRVLAVEGMLQWAPDIEQRLGDAAQRELILEVLAGMESEASVSAATGHLLAVGTTP